MDLLLLLGFAVLGAALAVLGTIIGAGGGFLLVPVLRLLGWPHEQAAATSLLMVTANAASGSVAYLRQRLVDLRSGWRLAVCTVPGALLGTLVADRVSGGLFDLLFAAVLALVGGGLLVRPGTTAEGTQPTPGRPQGWRGVGWTVRTLTDARGRRFHWGYSQPGALALSAAVGVLSSTLGIGGGIIHVPALIRLFHFPAHVATATSHFILALTAATGTAANLYAGHVRLQQGAALSLGALCGAQLGGAVAHRIRAAWIIRGLAAALLLVAARLVWSSVSTTR